MYGTSAAYSPDVAIETINNFITSSYGAQTLSSFLTHFVAPMSGFSTNLQGSAISTYGSWVHSVTDPRPVSYYVTRDRNALDAILGAGYDWMTPMRDYEVTGTNPGVMVPALMNAAGDIHVLLQESLNQHAETEQLLALFDWVYFPHSQAIWDGYGVLHSAGDIFDNGHELYNYIVGDPARIEDLSLQMQGVMDDNDDELRRRFYKEMISDDVIFLSANLRNTSSSQWAPQMKNITSQYANLDSAGTFMDTWTPLADSILRANTSLGFLLNIVYNAATDTVIHGYVTTATSADLAHVISTMPGMSVSAYAGIVVGNGVLSTSQIASLNLGMMADTIRLAEHHIYGGSRLGIQTYDPSRFMSTWGGFDPMNPTPVLVATLPATVPWYSYEYADLIYTLEKEPWGHTYLDVLGVNRNLGLRYYEMSDHLGNVLATVMDRKSGHISGTPSLYDYWHANVAGAQDYYPFGMHMPGRVVGVDSRFGFNGQQKDNEIGGNGTTLDFGERIYNSNLGRFMSLDALTKKYPYYSPYQFAGNKPIACIDIDGLEEFWAINGVLIGAGKPEDRRKMLVLTKAMMTTIENMSVEQRSKLMDNLPWDVVTIPTPAVIVKFEESLAAENAATIENGFAIGVDNTGKMVTSKLYTGTSEKIELDPAVSELSKTATVIAVAHLHPTGYTGSLENDENFKAYSSIKPSTPEIGEQNDLSSQEKRLAAKQVSQSSIVIGIKYKQTSVLEDPGRGGQQTVGKKKFRMEPIPAITYYEITKEQNGSYKLSDLKKLSQKVYAK